MIVLAVLLLVAAAALVIWVIMGLNGNNANTIHFNAPGIDTHIKPLTLFLLGALTLLLVWAATRLIAAGTKRKYRKHKETKELKRENKELEKEHERELKQQERVAAKRDHGTTADRQVVEDRGVARDTAQTRPVEHRVVERDVIADDSTRPVEPESKGRHFR